MQTIKKKKLNKFIKKSKNNNEYINQTEKYLKLFNNFPEIKFLLNQILEADRLLKQNLLPQSLPKMILPDNIQDIIYRKISEKYPLGNSEGDQLWDQLTSQLPKLDKHLRNFRDYLENNYGMWAYISAPFGKQLSNYLQNKNVLEIMAGNGYVSKALRQYNPSNKNYATDSKTRLLHQIQEGSSYILLIFLFPTIFVLFPLKLSHRYANLNDLYLQKSSGYNRPI